MNTEEKDLDIAIYKLWEALHAGLFEDRVRENIQAMYDDLKARRDERKLNLTMNQPQD